MYGLLYERMTYTINGFLTYFKFHSGDRDNKTSYIANILSATLTYDAYKIATIELSINSFNMKRIKTRFEEYEEILDNSV